MTIRDRWGYLLLAIVLLWLLSWVGGAAWANETMPYQAVCRISASSATDSSATYHGSGALYHTHTEDSGERVGYIITCAHTFRDSREPYVVTFPTNRKHRARITKIDHDLDLAILKIQFASHPVVQPATLVRGVEPRGQLQIAGFGSGRFQTTSGKVVDKATSGKQESYVISARPVRQGDSGGPVLDDQGRIVGVCWGTADGNYAVSNVTLTQFCDPCGSCRQPLVVVPSQRPVIAQPLQPIPRPNNQTGPQQSIVNNCQCDKKWAAIEAKQEKNAADIKALHIQAQQLIKLEESNTAKLKVIADAVDAVRENPGLSIEQIIEQLPPVTIRYLKGDGTPYDTARVQLGGTLDVAPLKIERVVNGQLRASGSVPVGGSFRIVDDYSELLEELKELNQQ